MKMFWTKRKDSSPAATDETKVETSPTDLEQGVQQPSRGLAPIIECVQVNGNKDKGGKQPLEPSEKFTGHQKFYIFALDGVGGMALSGGVNFAIAYGEHVQVLVLIRD